MGRKDDNEDRKKRILIIAIAILSIATIATSVFAVMEAADGECGCSEGGGPYSPPARYTVYFDSQGGSYVPSQAVYPDSRAPEPSAPFRAGYSFAGWYKEASCVNAWDFETDLVRDADVTLYAGWETLGAIDEPSYTVTFDTRGGSTLPQITGVDYNSRIVAPPSPSRSGYSFDRWYKEASCVNAWSFASDRVTGNVTLYAGWSLSACTVTFDSKGGSPVPSATGVIPGSAISAPSPPPTREGYGFDGWYSDSECTMAWNFSDPVTGSMTLYAKWELNRYAVTFDPQNGSPASQVSDIEHGSAISAPSPPPTRTGYDFGGWHRDPGGTEAWNFSDPVTESMTLYAKWDAARYRVTYHFPLASGEGPTEEDWFYYDQPYQLLEPVRAPYDFGGWFLKIGGVNSTPGSAAVVANVTPYPQSGDWTRDSDLALYAYWAGTPDLLYTGTAAYAVSKGTADTSAAVVIPEYRLGYKVTSVQASSNAASGAFSGCAMTGIYLPETITSIGNYAFSGCTGLTALDLPSSLVSIGNYSFSGCTGLDGDLSIPASVTSIGNYAFQDCAGMDSLSLDPSGALSTIGNYAFRGCTDLGTALTIPASVTSIGGNAFNGCSALSALHFATPGKSVTIGSSAFQNCTGLNAGQSGDPNIALEIPARVTSIGQYAFNGCSGLGGLSFAGSLASIGQYAFAGCSGLDGALVLPVGLTAVANGVFSRCSGLDSLTFPAGCLPTSIGVGAFNECSGLGGDLAIPSSVKTIGDNAFIRCEKLTGLRFETGSVLESIGVEAFSGCKGIESALSIPASVKTIGKSAFDSCAKIIALSFDAGGALESIGDSAFAHCRAIDGSLILPSALKSIGQQAFYGCMSLDSVFIPISVDVIGAEAFGACSSLYITAEYPGPPAPPGWGANWNWNRPVTWP
ncbi:MAG: leucine-rich repeat protein [Candidatus Methanoplasma sp.]|jgi:uncharacterized repeat protein (TIGR02543 family)|nr:leucine-rich repeat protein [Candidatus Methanoplasma sp.]